MTYTSLEAYSGHIIARTETTFTAQLVSDQSPSATLEAVFDLEELDRTDRPFAVEGALLDWKIGYRDEHGLRRRESEVSIRKPGAFPSMQVEADHRNDAHWG